MSQTSAKNNTRSFRLRKGLDLNIKGHPQASSIEELQETKVSSVAIVADDYPGMKPTFLVKEGEQVKKGQPLFTDKKNPLVQYTSPAGGKITAINRGAKRAFQSVVVAIDSNEKEVVFTSFTKANLQKMKREDVVKNLLACGLWTSIIARPYGKVANPEAEPSSLFINAMDTAPHAPSPDAIIANRAEAFEAGVLALSHLSKKTFVVKKADSTLNDIQADSVENVTFDGPHPAGLSGTHIHFLDPVYKEKQVWSVQYPDVLAIGDLFLTGKLNVERIVSLAGPAAKNPRLLKTRRGASLAELTQNEMKASTRVVSGSLLSGRTAKESFAYLGQFHNQISLVSEQIEREFLGWMSPGANKFSVKNVFLSAFTSGKSKEWNFTAALNGSHRTIIPVGSYEKVMPLDMQPTFLLRAMLSNNLDLAENLGVLELIEEDMALLTFVSPTKDNFAQDLRHVLTEIEREG